jgi:uncharacterized membrane protein
MGRRLAWLSTALVLLAGVGYQFLVHEAVLGALPPALRLGLKLVPLLGLALWVALRARHKAAWSCGLAAAAGLVWWLDHLPAGSALAYGLPHAAVYLFLLGFFARTLAPGHTALVTQLALRVHGTLPPRVAAYTRTLTAVWCVFFAAELLTSALLFLYAPRATWALFITALHFPLVVLMFALELGYRRWRFPEHSRTSILQAMQVFNEHTAPTPTPTPTPTPQGGGTRNGPQGGGTRNGPQGGGTTDKLQSGVSISDLPQGRAAP